MVLAFWLRQGFDGGLVVGVPSAVCVCVQWSVRGVSNDEIALLFPCPVRGRAVYGEPGVAVFDLETGATEVLKGAS